MEFTNWKVQLSSGEVIELEELVTRYEALLPKLEVGVWYLIDRNVIKSRMVDFKKECESLGERGVNFFNRCKESLQEAYKQPDYYTPQIETFIFEKTWESKTEQELRDMCEEIGDGQTDPIIADLELMMRFCNEESVNSLINESDTLPFKRVIKSYDRIYYLGGGSKDENKEIRKEPPAKLNCVYYISPYSYDPDTKFYSCTTSAFRQVW